MTTWKDFAIKSANWFTDRLIVDPLTSLYRKQNEAHKKQLAKKNKQVQDAPKTPPSGRHDALVRLAQDVSNSYRGPLGRPTFYHGGKVVAR